MTSGITKRWLLNILSVVALIIVAIVLCLSFRLGLTTTIVLNSLFLLDVTN